MKLSKIKTKPVVWDLLPMIAVLLLAAALFLSLTNQPGGRLTAAVFSEGREIDRVIIRAGDPSMERTYTSKGFTLTVTFCPDGAPAVQVVRSDCPSQDCVHTGAIKQAGQSIVCLPAQFSVKLSGHSDQVDAVIG